MWCHPPLNPWIIQNNSVYCVTNSLIFKIDTYEATKDYQAGYQ